MSWVTEAESLAGCLHRAFYLYADERYLGVRVKPGTSDFHGSWVDCEHFHWATYADALQVISRVACGFRNRLSMPPRTSFGICSENRPEWLFADFAGTFNNQIVVGLHGAWPAVDINLTIRDVGLSAIVVAANLAKHIRSALDIEPCPSLRFIVLIGEEETPTSWPEHISVTSWAELVNDKAHDHVCSSHTGFGIVQVGQTELDPVVEVKELENWTEPHTLIYSSGTTNSPKGVVVTKKRWKVDAMAGGVAVVDPRQVCSYMALAHGADRGIVWQATFCGGSIGFADGHGPFDSLLEDIRGIRPRFFLGLSHFWNRVYAEFEHQLSVRLRPLCLHLLRPHVPDLGSLTEVNAAAVKSPSFRLLEKQAVRLREGAEVRAWLIERTQQMMGDQSLVKAVTGGAHTSPEVIAFMRDLMSEGNDTGVFDAYGTTEFPGISVNGVVSEAIDIKLVDVPEMGYFTTDRPPRGEIVVKTKKADEMTLEYFKRPKDTAETWKEGWCYTGDIGSLEERHPDKILRIIDRKKDFEEMYVRGRSVWVPTAELEERVYQGIEGVKQVLLVADRNANALVAILVPEDRRQVRDEAALKTHFLGLLAWAGRNLKNEWEIPAGVIIEMEPWTVENGWLSVVGKLRRGALKQRYKSQLDAIYAQLEVEEEKGILHNKAVAVQAVSGNEDVEKAIQDAIQATKEAVELERKEPKQKQQNVELSEFITTFEFQAKTVVDTQRLNEIWHKFRDLSRLKRDMQEKWTDERTQQVLTATNSLEQTISSSRKSVQDAVASLVSSQETLTATREVIRTFESMKAQIKRAQQQVAAVREPIEQLRVYHEANEAFRGLQIVANATNCVIPWQLRGTVEWIWPPQTGVEPPAIPIGEAKVWCDVCGVLVEETVEDEGKPRLHCLDCPSSDQCGACYDLLRVVESHLRSSSSSDVTQALRELGKIDRHASHALSRDALHICHLQDRTKKYLAEEDTPAGFILSACAAYYDRLALGIPASFTDVNRPGARAFSSALAKAGGFSLRLHESFLWLTYAQLGMLAMRVARRLLSLGLHGQFIGICGYNSFEWSVADFACMIAGCGVVGFHTTYSDAVAQQVFANANVSALFCCKDVVQAGSTWSLVDLFRDFPTACQSLKHVILMDEGDVSLPNLTVHRMLDWARPESDALPSLPDPYQQRGVPCKMEDGSTVDVVTLLYTSGSSGAPKGVMMSALSFISDIRERSFASPLVTASYIPLSHSSDRMKLWEFLGNGGRVGFVYYDPCNWSDHETLKKAGMIDTQISGTNGVEALFEQICLLKPTALSCPTRIWNGFYAFYQILVQSMSPPEALAKLASMFGSRIQFVATGGSPTSAVVKEFIKRLLPACNFVDSYGTTECGAITANGYVIKNKGVRVVLRDVPERGFTNADKPFPRGEITVSTPNMSPGYFHQPEATAASFVNGWYRTGDLGRFDPSTGRYEVLERISAVMSLRDGTIVFPGSLEAMYGDLNGWANLVHLHVPTHGNFLVAVVVPSERLLARLTDSQSYCSVLSCSDYRPCNKHFAEQDEAMLLQLFQESHQANCHGCHSPAHVPKRVRIFQQDQAFLKLVTGSLKLPRQELNKLFMPLVQSI